MKRALLCEIAFSMLPAITNAVLSYILPVPLANYVGPASQTLAILDVLCCAVIYHFVLSGQNKVNTSVQQIVALVVAEMEGQRRTESAPRE